MAAMIETVALRGYGETSVAEVSARAGVARHVFHELYIDREDCFLAAFDDIVLRGCLRLVDACRELDGWAEQVSSGLFALLSFLDEQPFAARFLVIESFGVSTRVLWRRSRLLDRFVEVVHDGACVALGAGLPAPSRAVARGVVLTVHSVVYESLVCGGALGLAQLAGMLAGVVVLPYLGEEAACAELGAGSHSL
jgi:AcrR family transcriptional regulator